MGCCENIEKHLLIYINGACAIIAFLTMFVGVWIICDGNLTEKLHLSDLPYTKSVVGIIFIVCGILSICLCGAGIWGALKEITLWLRVYAWIMIIGLVSNVIQLIFTYNIMDIKNLPFLQTLFEKYNHNDKGANADVDFIQETFKCCGYIGPEDYRTSIFQEYPASCCNSSVNCFTPDYTQGCLYRLEDLVHDWMVISTILMIVSAVLHITCIVSAFRLASKIVKKSTLVTVYHKM